MFRQKFLAHPRLVVKAVQRGLRRDLHQIAVAFVVFRQYQQVVVGIALGRRAVVVFLANVKLATDDRLNVKFVRGVDEMHRAKNISVVGHGNRGHAQLFHALAKLFDIAGAIKQGVVGMQVQVDELGHGLSLVLRWLHSNG